MILVDKDIKEYIRDNKLIEEGYQEENLNGVSYDLTIEHICDGEKEHFEYELKPGETVFVKSAEKLRIPDNILGRVAEKNSRMRQGLKVDGPHYQPGHITYAFLRVQNISGRIIALQKGMKIAQIIFEQLTQVPDVPYSVQQGASFQNEVEYRGVGNYSAEYSKQIKNDIEQAKEDIESASRKIYANVLTLMGILVAIFSLLTINYQAFTQAVMSLGCIVVMNLTFALCIVVMMGIILIFINRAKSKYFLGAYIIILIMLAVATGIASCVIL